MYRVKGGDNLEYGPVTSDQIRQWIRENRLNRASLAEPAGTSGWRPLGELSEFADVLAAQSAPSLPPAQGPIPGHETSVSGASEIPPSLTLPGVLLTVYSILMLLLSVVSLVGRGAMAGALKGVSLPANLPPQVREILGNAIAAMQTPGTGFYVQMSLSIVAYTIMAAGGIFMMQRRLRPLALAGAILAVIPCHQSCCCLIGLPIGLWCLILLMKPEVTRTFR
jgi:hypothetical protein